MSIKRRDAEMQSSFLIERRDAETQRINGVSASLRLCVQSNLSSILCLLSLYLLIACAQQQPLTGGDKDEVPPKINQELSTPSHQTNFTKQTLEFEFDEYIQLQNLLKQLVISPPLERIPKVTTKLKKLIFEFPEEEILKEDATYSINFGEAVKDLTEGNPVPDFKFIFSTGDFIDSLKVEGSIIDAITGDAVEGALYMLYDNLADSVVQTEKPFYFGKTDSEGKFLIENIKAGNYKGFALEDQDLNYLFNIPSERIGFSMDTIVVKEDSVTLSISAAIFEPYSLVGKPKADVKKYGLVTLAFKREPFDAKVTLEDVGQTSFIETVEDTIKVWYHTPDSLDWSIYVHRDTLTDTIAVRGLAKNLAQKKLNSIKIKRQEKTINLNPFKPIQLPFNHPIQKIDTSLIIFTEDSVRVSETIDTTTISTDSTQLSIDTTNISIDSTQLSIDTTDISADTTQLSVDTTIVSSENTATRIQAQFQIDSIEQRTLSISYDWKETLQYELQILPGAITDLYGLTNTDTLQLSYLIKEQKDFGNINLTASGMDSLQTYQFELLFAQNVVESFSVTGQTDYKRTFSSLPPGKYSVKVIEDLNGNGRWDSGDYYKKLQPENISTATLEELKANWDVEANVVVEF